jgi:hypothetical protein
MSVSLYTFLRMLSVHDFTKEQLKEDLEMFKKLEPKELNFYLSSGIGWFQNPPNSSLWVRSHEMGFVIDWYTCAGDRNYLFPSLELDAVNLPLPNKQTPWDVVYRNLGLPVSQLEPPALNAKQLRYFASSNGLNRMGRDSYVTKKGRRLQLIQGNPYLDEAV